MDALLKETVDAAINSRYPDMAPEGRRLIEEILIRKEVEKGALLLNEGQISHNIVFVGKGKILQSDLIIRSYNPFLQSVLKFRCFLFAVQGI